MQGRDGGREGEKKRAHIIFWHVNPGEHWAIWAALTPSTRGRKIQWLQSHRAEYCHCRRVAFVLLATTTAQSNRSLCPRNTVLGFKEYLVYAGWQHHLSFSLDNMYKSFQTPLWAAYIVPACSWNALSMNEEGCVAGSLGTPDEANVTQRDRRWVSLPCTCSGTETREPKSANLLSVHWDGKLASFLRDLNLVFHLSGILYEMKGRFWLTVKPKLKGRACKVLSLAGAALTNGERSLTLQNETLLHVLLWSVQVWKCWSEAQREAGELCQRVIGQKIERICDRKPSVALKGNKQASVFWISLS